MKRFDPRVPKENGTKIWKEGDSSYDAVLKKQEIHQIVYVEKDGKVETFDHYVTLHLYSKDDLFNVIKLCGFEVVGEYCDYNFTSSDNLNSNKFIEIKKTESVEA